MLYNEKTKKIRVNDAIALCHIIDEYSEFNKNLIKFISTKYNRDDVYNLFKISNGKFVLGAFKTKRFYKNNKSVIDEINKHTSISNFININYDSQGNLREDSCLDKVYQYILSHRDELEKILSVLLKIKELDFKEIEFDENLDFTDTKYDINTNFSYEELLENDIVYLDNMEVVPNYSNDIVEYKTTCSNYKIILEHLHYFLSSYNKDIIDFNSFYNRRITVNSLTFDPSTLPYVISKPTTYDKIISLKQEQKEKCTAIRNSVDLSVSIEDLKKQFNLTNKIIEDLDKVESKSELLEILSRINSYIGILQDMSKKYDESISNSHSSITKETLDKEKQAYLKRRNSLDFD